MGTLTKGKTFSSTEEVTNTKLHNLVDLGSVTAIVNADIDNAAQIAATKLAAIATVSKVSGAALFNLASTPAGGGILPVTGGGTGVSGNTYDADKVDGIDAAAAATANKLLALDTNSKLPASITGDADTVDSIHAASTATASKLMPLDTNVLVPVATLPVASQSYNTEETTNSGTYVDLSGGSGTLVLTVNSNVAITLKSALKCAGEGYRISYIRVVVDSTQVVEVSSFAGTYEDVTGLGVVSLNAGTYTIKMQDKAENVNFTASSQNRSWVAIATPQ